MAGELDAATVERQYEAAKARLLPIAMSLTATDEQREAAARALDDLNRDFLGQVVGSIEERTQQFEAFIDRMERAIAELQQSSVLASVELLQSVVDESSAIVTALRDADPRNTG